MPRLGSPRPPAAERFRYVHFRTAEKTKSESFSPVALKQEYPQRPPRVEYRLTPLGRRFCGLLDEIETLQREFEG